MSGGMTGIFGGGGMDPAAVDAALEENVRLGYMEVVEEGPPRQYRLTPAGQAHVLEVFAAAGVSEAEAMAWISERVRAEGGDPGER